MVTDTIIDLHDDEDGRYVDEEDGLDSVTLFVDLGTLDVWDILFKQNEPTLSIQVVDEPLHCLRVQETQGRHVACGSQNGTVTLIELSDNLCTQGKSEKTLVNAVGLFPKFRGDLHGTP